MDEKLGVIQPQLLQTRGGIRTLDQAIENFDVSKVIKQFGTWAVTTHGVECLVSSYFFEFARVDEDDWESHMRDKPWVNIDDFSDALYFARECHSRVINKHKYRVRYHILKRDEFKCCFCGKSGYDGVELEVDHKFPVSRGGSNDDSNLQTLCHVCNRGKSNLLP